MGADLYIQLTYKKQRDKYEPAFYEWARKRDEAVDEEAEKVCQEKVTYYHNKMNDEAGYFRDSYNNSNLLNLFGISYWGNFNEYLDKGGVLTPANAQALLDDLAKREDTFTANLKTRIDEILAIDKTETKAKLRKYFISKYFQFQRFLQTAIKLQSNIECST